MNKDYEVTLSVTIEQTILISAESRDHAESRARDLFIAQDWNAQRAEMAQDVETIKIVRG